jgi:hypothetical protein
MSGQPCPDKGGLVRLTMPDSTGRTKGGSLDPPVRLSGVPHTGPRLLNLHQAAEYLNVSYWSVRDYVLQGLIPVVQLPPLRAREGERPRHAPLRRVLVDRCDLDDFITERKQR